MVLCGEIFLFTCIWIILGQQRFTSAMTLSWSWSLAQFIESCTWYLAETHLVLLAVYRNNTPQNCPFHVCIHHLIDDLWTDSRPVHHGQGVSCFILWDRICIWIGYGKLVIRQLGYPSVYSCIQFSWLQRICQSVVVCNHCKFMSIEIIMI